MKKKCIITYIKNIIVILFFWLIGVIVGGYFFYALGTENINDKLIVSSYNSGYITGYMNSTESELKAFIEKIDKLLRGMDRNDYI